MELKDKKKFPLWLPVAIAAALIIAIIAGVTIYSRSPAQQAKKQISLGERFLTELNYEQAVAAFSEALKIDPKNADAGEALVQAYLSWADALADAGDTEQAITILEQGIGQITDARLTDKLASMKERLAKEPESAASEQTAVDQEDADTSSGSSDTDRFHAAQEAILEMGQYPVMGKPFIDWEIDTYIDFIRANGESTNTGAPTEIESYFLNGMSADIHTADNIAEVFDPDESAYSQMQEDWFRCLHHYGDQPSAKYPALGMRMEDFFAQFDITMDEVNTVASSDNKVAAGDGWYLFIDPGHPGYLVETFDREHGKSIRFATEDGIIQTIMIEKANRAE
ncbi:MAG: tetratricopeptide repeat protein [Lachnospiraceae bacterium]|nr:tetratricopeptide repeat protein [Lachnospiraceae bacterium]